MPSAATIPGLLIGYARVPTDDQNLDLQRASCGKVFEQKESGRAGTKRPALEGAPAYLRPEDQRVVWKVDRLGRSLRGTPDTAHELQGQGMKLHSLTEAVSTETPTGRLMFNLTEDDLAVARAMLEDPIISVAQVACRMAVSHTNFHAYLPAARKLPTSENMDAARKSGSAARGLPGFVCGRSGFGGDA